MLDLSDQLCNEQLICQVSARAASIGQSSSIPCNLQRPTSMPTVTTIVWRIPILRDSTQPFVGEVERLIFSGEMWYAMVLLLMHV